MSTMKGETGESISLLMHNVYHQKLVVSKNRMNKDTMNDGYEWTFSKTSSGSRYGNIECYQRLAYRTLGWFVHEENFLISAALEWFEHVVIYRKRMQGVDAFGNIL